MWDSFKWLVENIWTILTLISITVAMVQTWRASRKGFWTKLKEVAGELINDVESMPDFKPGEGSRKRDWVIKELLEEFSGKFSFLSEKKLQKVIDTIVKSFNTFSKLN